MDALHVMHCQSSVMRSDIGILCGWAARDSALYLISYHDMKLKRQGTSISQAEDGGAKPTHSAARGATRRDENARDTHALKQVEIVCFQ